MRRDMRGSMWFLWATDAFSRQVVCSLPVVAACFVYIFVHGPVEGLEGKVAQVVSACFSCLLASVTPAVLVDGQA